MVFLNFPISHDHKGRHNVVQPKPTEDFSTIAKAGKALASEVAAECMRNSEQHLVNYGAIPQSVILTWKLATVEDFSTIATVSGRG